MEASGVSCIRSVDLFPIRSVDLFPIGCGDSENEGTEFSEPQVTGIEVTLNPNAWSPDHPPPSSKGLLQLGWVSELSEMQALLPLAYLFTSAA